MTFYQCVICKDVYLQHGTHAPTCCGWEMKPIATSLVLDAPKEER